MPKLSKFTKFRGLLNGVIFCLVLCCVQESWADRTAVRYTVTEIDPTVENLQVFHADEQGQPFQTFDRLAEWLKKHNKRLVFAMNAGMYHTDLSPVGLEVQDGKEIYPLNLAQGQGNFFLKPNGVFMLTETGAAIIESTEYPALANTVLQATQSGPLLLRHGKIHSAFRASSISRKIRNGVGISNGKVFFVISEIPVNFYEFAVYFRDQLQCHDTLYLDGVVSSMYSEELKRNDNKLNLGPIIGVAH